jgi:GH15 family glucan-1,4-alpha-glucosidase
LQQYALLADGERGAIVGPRGDIVWMCAPSWDSPSLFSALVGGLGRYSVTPSEPFVWGGCYDEASMVWTSRWNTATGTTECRDALGFPGHPGPAVLLRRLRAEDGPSSIDVVLQPRGDYDRDPMSDLHRHGEIWTARCGPLYLRWTGASAAHSRNGGQRLEAHFDLQPGQHHDLVLEISAQPLPDEPVGADVAWRATEAAWANAVPELDNCLASRDARSSYAVLRGLTGHTGGMVAAATTSLPERAEAGRNYDYRYVWIRDQCFAGIAAAAIGDDYLLDQAVRFVTARLLEHGDQLSPAYTTTGQAVPRPRHLDLPGYPGGFDIVGNQVNDQFQLDIFGEALQLYAVAARRDRLDPEDWKAAEVAAIAIGRRWEEPDAGIWELENRPWTHSRLTASGGLKAIAAAHSGVETAEWLTLADRIIADTSATSLDPTGSWRRSPNDDAVDAALLFAGIRGAIPVDDPRTGATLEACLRDLTVDGYAYRFRHDDRPLEEAEGSFLLCGFLVALALHESGRALDARGWYERTRAACGPPLLLSEEFDARQRQMRGNLPQAFVHALMLETSARLAE